MIGMVRRLIYDGQGRHWPLAVPVHLLMDVISPSALKDLSFCNASDKEKKKAKQNYLCSYTWCNSYHKNILHIKL